MKKCPICHKDATKNHRPFCSRHCSNVDLYCWLHGQYAITKQEKEETKEDIKTNG